MQNLKFTEILQRNSALVGKYSDQTVEIGILSNVTINSLEEILAYSCRLNGLEPQIEIGNFDNILQDSAGFASKDQIIVFYEVLNIVDNVSGFFEELSSEKFDQLLGRFRGELDIIFSNLKGTKSVVFNSFSSLCFPANPHFKTQLEEFVDRMNAYLSEYKPANFTVLNTDRIFAQLGTANCIDFRFYHSSKAPYTFKFLKLYVEILEATIIKNNGKLRKALIFDCDNTLWGGVLGEDGLENIQMSLTSPKGQFFKKVQEIAIYLSKRGVIVCICSKNNHEDVDEVLIKHPNMLLKDEHLVIKKVNWQDKATNLRHIAQELNIGIDSLVFVDDSDFEVNLVNEQLPEVLTFQVPKNVASYPDELLKLVYKYFNLVSNADDLRKIQMYKQQFEREELKNTYDSIEDYLKSLEIEISIVKDDLVHLSRIAQLTQKTNQFNLTAIRYTETQIENFMTSLGSVVLGTFVKDKFGDSGLTGICILKRDEMDETLMHIDSLLMSCRVIGRNIETKLFGYIVDHAKELGVNTLRSTYRKTKKNKQVDDFFDKCGMSRVSHDEECTTYSLDLQNYKIEKLDYIKLNN